MRAPLLSLLAAALESSSPLMRCLAAEGLGRLVQVVGDPGFSVSVSLLCLDRCGGDTKWRETKTSATSHQYSSILSIHKCVAH